MKRIMGLILILILLLSVMNPGGGMSASAAANGAVYESYHAIPGVTQAEINAIEDLKGRREGFTYGHLLETESFRLPDGTFDGFTIRVCELFSALFGITFTPLYCEEWDTLKTGITNCEIDFTGCLTPTEEREKTLFMSSPIGGRGLKIYTNAESGEITAEDDLTGLKIGFMKGTVTREMVMKSNAGFSAEAADVNSISEAAEMLRTGELSAFIIDGTVDPQLEDYDFIRSRALFWPVYLPVSVSTGDPELRPVISVIDKFLAAGGMDTMRALYDEGLHEYNKLTLFKALSGAEKDYLAKLNEKGKAVKIALEYDNYPFSFYNTKERRFEGLAVDVLEQISQLTGLRFENTTTPTTPWAEIIEELKSGEVSMVSHLGYSDEREDYSIWSAVPYSVDNYVLISKSDFRPVRSDEISRFKTGVYKGSVYEYMYRRWFPASTNLSVYETTNDTFDALERGEVDLVMGAEFMMLSQTYYREKSGYAVNYRFDTSLDSVYGFNRSEVLLRSIVDKALARIELKAVSNYWSGRLYDYTGILARQRMRFLLILASGLVLALLTVSLLFWKNSRLGKSLKRRAARHDKIINTAQIAFLLTVDGVAEEVNEYVRRNMGIGVGDSVLPAYADPAEQDLLTKTAEEQGSASNMILRYNMKNGEVHRFLANSALVEYGGKQGYLVWAIDIEQDTRVSDQLRATRQSLQKILDSVPLPIGIVDKETRGILYGNNVLLEMLELTSPEELTRLRGPDTFASEQENGETPAGLDELFSAAEGRLVKEVQIKTARGRIIGARLHASHADYNGRPSTVAIVVDLAKEQEYRRMQQYQQTVLDMMPVPIRIFDFESKAITYVNNATLDMFGIPSQEDVIGKSVFQYVAGNAYSPDQLDRYHASAKPVSWEFTGVKTNGETFEVFITACLIEYNGKKSSLGIMQNLTEEKEYQRILMEAAAHEKEANRAKSLFLANMSHEIRTPMNGIIGMTDLLLGERITGRQLQYVKDIKTAAESLLGIINDILDLSKISEGKLKITPADVELSTILRNIVSMIGFSARIKGLQFIDDIQIGTPECVLIDDVRFKQILINLLSNAVKFTKEGHIKLTAKRDGGILFFEVSDTGIGIKPESLSKIFGAFEQADMLRNRSIKGTGLGLSITKSLVELMGGRIEVKSTYGEGTVFTVTLPYVPGDLSKAEDIGTEFQYICAPSANVLLVDDIQTNLTVGAGLLRLCGITASVALSGREAIRLAQTKSYDLIFMDHMMPEMDGIEAMRHIRDLGGAYRTLPIIALTANAMMESRDLLLSSGMDDFLSKPIDKAALMDILKKWLPPEKLVSNPDGAALADTGGYSAVLDRAAKIDGLNIEQALGRIGGLQDVLETSLKQVAVSADEKLKKMDAHLSNRNLSGFAVEAHGIKGALANIGATYNSELAAQLEIAAKADNIKLCVDKFAEFASALEGFSSELKEVFVQRDEMVRHKGDVLLLRETAGSALRSLEDFEAAGALARLHELEPYTFGAEADQLLRTAAEAAEAYRYQDAAGALRLLQNCSFS